MPIKFNQFSTLLIDQLKNSGWQVSKKRLNSGTIIYGVKLTAIALSESKSQLPVAPPKEDISFSNEF